MACSSRGRCSTARLVYIATAEGLRWTCLERLGVYRVGPGGFRHAVELAAAAVALHEALPDCEQLSERELRISESDDSKLIASASVGELPGGRPALHRPDLALIGPEGRVLAIEIELSIKAPRRLQAICRGYARARHVSHVYYLATPPAARAVSRAVADTRSEARITVLALTDVDSILAAERIEAGDRRV
jgi:hypothetical protein